MIKNISRVAFFMLIACSSANLLFCMPIKNNSAEATEVKYQQNETKFSNKNFKTIDENESKRAKRQVVQPTWLTDKEVPNPFIDQRVRVTEQNLREAAAIRKAIQSAVDADTFAVDLDQPSDPNNIPAKFTFPESTSPESSPPKSLFSFFPMKFPAFRWDFSAFQRALQPFVSSTGSKTETQDTAISKTAKPEDKANNEFQKAWLEFKKKWPAETANFAPFVSSTVNEAETEAKTVKSDSQQSNEFQKTWLEFIENSKQMVSSMPRAETAAENEFIEEFDNLWTEFEDNFMKIWSVDLFT